jgi:hypothetical protein
MKFSRLIFLCLFGFSGIQLFNSCIGKNNSDKKDSLTNPIVIDSAQLKKSISDSPNSKVSAVHDTVDFVINPVPAPSSDSFFIQQKRKNYWDFHGFYGKVKSVRQTAFDLEYDNQKNEYVKGKISKEYSAENQYMEFDSTGKYILEEFLYADGTPKSKEASEYDANDFLVKLTRSEDDSKIITLYEYDRIKNIKKTFTMKNGKKHLAEMEWYDKKGNEVKDSSLNFLSLSLYDSAGNELKRITYEEDRRSTANKSVYDKNGNLVSSKYYDDGVFHDLTKYFSRDSAGLKVSGYEKFDPQGNLIGYEYSCRDKYNNEVYWYMKDFGVEVKRETKFTYDKYGNWIKSVERKNGTPEYMEERVIVYF